MYQSTVFSKKNSIEKILFQRNCCSSGLMFWKWTASDLFTVIIFRCIPKNQNYVFEMQFSSQKAYKIAQSCMRSISKHILEWFWLCYNNECLYLPDIILVSRRDWIGRAEYDSWKQIRLAHQKVPRKLTITYRFHETFRTLYFLTLQTR